MTEIVSAHDYSETFTMQEAAGLILGPSRTFQRPKDYSPVLKRMRDDASKGLLAVVNGHIAREEIARWLVASGLKSQYRFDRSLSDTDDAQSRGLENDPPELPRELDTANIAFRAVLNGYGDQSATFRNRLIEYLKKNHPSMTPQTVERIATVANPDKSTGRKKQDKE